MRSARSTVARLAVAAVIVVALCGCESVTGLLGQRDHKSAPSDFTIIQHLQELDRLGDGTYQEKLDLFLAIQSAYYADLSDTNRLRYALAKSVTGHSFSNLPGAFVDLRNILEAPDELRPAQQQLAQIMFRNLEHQMIVDAQNAQLRDELSTSASTSTARDNRQDARLGDIQRRLKMAEADNRKLEEELANARRQLDAIMSIETSSDRDN